MLRLNMANNRGKHSVRLSKNKNVIMPQATAVWLIDNTSLTFKQIGDFCNISEMEIKLMADNVIAKNIIGADPTKNGNLTREEIEAREKDGKPLTNKFTALDDIAVKIPKVKKYVSMIQRKNCPNAILWLVSFYPNLSDGQIIKLVHTTKNMVNAIRTKTYSKYSALVAKDPVAFGFCTQTELNKNIAEAENNQKESEKALISDKERKVQKKVRKINVNKVKSAKKLNKRRK